MTFRAIPFIRFILATLITAVSTTLLSTQVILHALETAGADISWGVRLDAYLTDLVGFGPTLLALTALGFLIAFPTAHLISSRLNGLRLAGYILAGFVTIMVMIYAIELFYHAFLASTITPIASARTLSGLLLIGLGGGLGGLVFAVSGKPAAG